MKNVRKSIDEFENNPELITYKFKADGVPMYFYIRVPLLNRSFYKESINGDLENIRNKVKAVDIFKYIATIIKYNPFFLKNKKILFISDNNLCQMINKDDKYVNWLHDPFANLFEEDTCILERQSKYNCKFPRDFKHTKSQDLLLILSVILSKFKKTQDLLKIKEFLIYLKGNFPLGISQEMEIWIYNELVKRSRLNQIQTRLWKKIFLSNKCRFVVFHVGFYGGMSHIIKLAKEMGIKTADIQHGISRAYDATYHYGKELMLSKEFSQCYPDFFLTFGNFWNELLSEKLCTKTLGYPIEYSSGGNTGKDVTFCTNSMYYAEMKVLIERFIQDYKGKYTVNIRPHPRENKEKYMCFVEKYGVRLIDNLHIVDVMKLSEVIVTPPSSVAFEATAMGVNCIVYNPKGEEILTLQSSQVRNYEELKKIINTKREGEIKDDNREQYFSSEWEKNYKDLIMSLDTSD